jgi:hypothetical protein
MTVVYHRARMRDAQLALCIMGAALSACASRPAGPPPEAKVVVQESKVAVAASCIPPEYIETADEPDTDDAVRAIPDGPSRYQFIAASRPAHRVTEAELKALVRGCQTK